MFLTATRRTSRGRLELNKAVVVGRTRTALFTCFSQLERLSIRGLCCSRDPSWGSFPITQEVIIKMVRHHPKLRWLRRNLTEEKAAMQKQKRPDITLLSD